MLLLHNGRVIDPKSNLDQVMDLVTDNGKILELGEHLTEKYSDADRIDASGLVVAPGLIDVHVHFRDPGLTYKEDIHTGAAAAAAGGFTTVVCMANTKPPVDNVETLEYVLAEGKKTPINVLSAANITIGMKGEVLTDMEALKAHGAAGFTDDGIPLKDTALVKKAMEESVRLNVPLSFHEEDPALITNNGINRGAVSEHFGIGGSPAVAEDVLVARDCMLALHTGALIDIQHISSKEAVELVRQAKKRCSNIHAEATPHHFTLTEDAVIKYGTLAKMNPPLREEEDRQAVIRGLVDGTIDMIATDHAPHTAGEKAKPITEAPSGITGLETSLALGITELVDEGYLTMKQLLRLMSTNPAAMYHLDAGYLAEGGPADVILIDTAAEFIPETYASKATNTPFTGWKLKGEVKMTICNGQIVYRA